jgi:hypothetical protein
VRFRPDSRNIDDAQNRPLQAVQQAFVSIDLPGVEPRWVVHRAGVNESVRGDRAELVLDVVFDCPQDGREAVHRFSSAGFAYAGGP